MKPGEWQRTVTAALAGACMMTAPAGAQTMRMLTEDYPPFGFERSGRIVGSAVDQVREIMDEAYPDYTLDILPWARAFALAQSDPAACVFATALLPERLPLFKWVQPLSVDVMMLVKRAGEPFHPATIDAARKFSVAVHLGDSAETYARELGFPKLDVASTLDLSLKKLLAGRVDLMIMTRKTFDGLRATGEPIEAVLDLRESRSGIACNPGIANETIAAMQAVLDKMVADGTQARIEQTYKPPAQ